MTSQPTDESARPTDPETVAADEAAVAAEQAALAAQAAEANDAIEAAMAQLLGQVAHPVNWNELDQAGAEAHWLALNAWTNWLRSAYLLGPAIVPPCWHEHWSMVWELSSLHTAWLGAFDPQQQPTAPISWHREFEQSRVRLRDWVSITGCTIDKHRPDRPMPWPGEPAAVPLSDVRVTDRESTFVDFVLREVASRPIGPGYFDYETGEASV